jgi:hypothetical protein
VTIAETVALVESAGVKFRFQGGNVRICYPCDELKSNLADQVSFLRSHREEVAALLKERGVIPMPPGVRLIEWSLKEPPIAIEVCAVVTDPVKFAKTTIEQLRSALENPRRWMGWTIPQLVDRLAQVGVVLTLEKRGG